MKGRGSKKIGRNGELKDGGCTLSRMKGRGREKGWDGMVR